jgi:hypothetical protein
MRRAGRGRPGGPWRRSAIGALATGAALAACATAPPTVQTDADPQTDFSRYRTYAWVYQGPPSGMSESLYEAVRDSIDRQLAAEGFAPGDPGDFAVAFTVGARSKAAIEDFGPYGPFYPGDAFGYGWGVIGYSDIDVRNVTEGSLVIDIYDVKTRKPIWHGVATGSLGSRRAGAGEIDRAVSAVLAEFPPA